MLISFPELYRRKNGTVLVNTAHSYCYLISRFSTGVCSVLAAYQPYIVGGLFKVKTFPLQSEYHANGRRRRPNESTNQSNHTIIAPNEALCTLNIDLHTLLAK